MGSVDPMEGQFFPTSLQFHVAPEKLAVFYPQNGGQTHEQAPDGCQDDPLVGRQP